MGETLSFIAAKHGLKKREEIPEGFDRNCFETPIEVFRYLDKKYKFKADLAANPDNNLCGDYYDQEADALTRVWTRIGYLFLNPPFSDMKAWVQKVQREADAGCRIVVLCNSNTLHTYYYAKRPAEQETKVIGRMSFCVDGKPIKGNASCQTILVFNKRLKPKVSHVLLRDIMATPT